MEYEEDEESYEEYEDSPAEVDPSKVSLALNDWNKIRGHFSTSQNEDGTKRINIRARKTAFVRSLIHLDGHPFSFEGREYLEPIYDRQDAEILMKNARQTEKSTYLSNDLVIKSIINPFNKSLYVSPSHMQTRQFSSEKLKPILDNSPLIKKYFQDSSVSQQVFEKGFLNGSFIFLRSAFRSADRCLPYDAEVLLSNCSVVKIKDLGVGDKVIAFNGISRTENEVVGKVCNGKKPIGCITLTSGHKLEATHNHRFMTDNGIKRLDEITEEDYIPVPFDFAPEGETRPEDIWMGLMQSDGCMTNSNNASRCAFSNNDLSLVDLYEKLTLELGVSEVRRECSVRNGKNNNYTATVRRQTESREILSKWNLEGLKYDTKFFPEEFFQNRGRIRGILKGFFEGNGWITWNVKTRRCEIGAITGSKSIAFGILRALQSIGIYAALEEWPVGTRGPRQRNDWYCIKIHRQMYIRRFSERVGLINKQKKLDEMVSFIENECRASDRDVDVPARDDCSRVLVDAKISSNSLLTKYGFKFSNHNNNDKRIALEKVEFVYNLTKDPRLLKWIDKGIKWIKVRDIKKNICIKETYDIEVFPDHIFTAGFMFTHNTRGISAKNLTLDEIQDMLIDQIPVIKECTSHFPDATTIMSGTPKSLNNPIEIYWKSTCQNEWLVPCEHCKKWNFLDERNIADTQLYINDVLPPGPVCRYCDKSIDIKKGRWVSLCPSNTMKGYRVPQLMVPWICGIKNQWLKLLWKRDNYPMSQLYNEVLGLSYDNASSPITMQELIDICGEHDVWDLDRMTVEQINKAKGMLLTAGVDWGEGLDGSEKSPSGKLRPASYTVLTIGYYHTQTQYKVVAIKKFTGKEVDPDYVVSYVSKTCKNLGIQLVGVDWGHGWGVNNTLVRLLGGKHVVQFQHLPKLKMRMRWDPVGVRYHLHRNFMMSEFFFDMKHGHVLFPKWSKFEPFSKDILAIYTEYNEYRREIKYDHRNSEPDDFFHSCLYAKLVADIMMGKSRRYTQIIETED